MKREIFQEIDFFTLFADTIWSLVMNLKMSVICKIFCRVLKMTQGNVENRKFPGYRGNSPDNFTS